VQSFTFAACSITLLAELIERRNEPAKETPLQGGREFMLATLYLYFPYL